MHPPIHDASEPRPRLESMDSSGAPPLRLGSVAGGSYGYSINALGATETHLNDYLKVLYKRRWTALTAFVIVVMSVCVYTFTSTPVFEARAQVLIEKESTNVVSFKEAYEQNQITDDYYQTQYRILQSRALARRTIDALKLWDHPQFNPKPDGSLTVAVIIGAPIALVSSWLRVAKPLDAPEVNETKTESSTID